MTDKKTCECKSEGECQGCVCDEQGCAKREASRIVLNSHDPNDMEIECIVSGKRWAFNSGRYFARAEVMFMVNDDEGPALVTDVVVLRSRKLIDEYKDKGEAVVDCDVISRLAVLHGSPTDTVLAEDCKLGDQDSTVIGSELFNVVGSIIWQAARTELFKSRQQACPNPAPESALNECTPSEEQGK